MGLEARLAGAEREFVEGRTRANDSICCVFSVGRPSVGVPAPVSSTTLSFLLMMRLPSLGLSFEDVDTPKNFFTVEPLIFCPDRGTKPDLLLLPRGAAPASILLVVSPEAATGDVNPLSADAGATVAEVVRDRFSVWTLLGPVVSIITLPSPKSFSR